MSLIGSLLAFVLIPLKAKPAAERPREIDNLAVMALADEVRRLTFALDFWRESGNALMAENGQLRQERDALRSQLALFNRLERIPQLAQQQLAQQQASLYNPQLAQYQGFQNVFADCTCVPARADAFRR